MLSTQAKQVKERGLRQGGGKYTLKLCGILEMKEL